MLFKFLRNTARRYSVSKLLKSLFRSRSRARFRIAIIESLDRRNLLTVSPLSWEIFQNTFIPEVSLIPSDVGGLTRDPIISDSSAAEGKQAGPTPHEVMNEARAINADESFSFDQYAFGSSEQYYTPAYNFSGVVIASLPSDGTLIFESDPLVQIPEIISLNLPKSSHVHFGSTTDENRETLADFQSFNLRVHDSGAKYQNTNADQLSRSFSSDFESDDEASTGADNTIPIIVKQYRVLNENDFGFSDYGPDIYFGWGEGEFSYEDWLKLLADKFNSCIDYYFGFPSHQAVAFTDIPGYEGTSRLLNIPKIVQRIFNMKTGQNPP